jgi:hypothetical protein
LPCVEGQPRGKLPLAATPSTHLPTLHAMLANMLTGNMSAPPCYCCVQEVSRGLLSPLAATLGPAGASEQLGFGEGFGLYGGGAAAEELETLACECARVCNR